MPSPIEQFATFVDATGWQTDAESFGWSFVFAGLLPDEFPPTRGVEGAPWWRQVMGADWRHPEGPQSDWSGRADHPVVHVSWNDAHAYCSWSGTPPAHRSRVGGGGPRWPRRSALPLGRTSSNRAGTTA